MTDNTSMLIRLNSSKQHQAPDWARPEKKPPIIWRIQTHTHIIYIHISYAHTNIKHTHISYTYTYHIHTHIISNTYT